MNNIKNMPTPDKIITDFSQADFIDILKQEIEGVPKVFKKGTVIEESDKEGLVYVIASGQVKVTKNGEIVAFLGEGDMFGLPDFVVKTRAAYTFTVLSKELMTEKYQQAHVLEKLSTIEGSFFLLLWLCTETIKMANKQGSFATNECRKADSAGFTRLSIKIWNNGKR